MVNVYWSTSYVYMYILIDQGESVQVIKESKYSEQNQKLSQVTWPGFNDTTTTMVPLWDPVSCAVFL